MNAATIDAPARPLGPASTTHRHGRLALTLERRGPRTIVAGQEVVFPSGTVRISDVDGDGVGELQITNPSGGLLAGDRLDTVLTAATGTRTSIVTQGANRICGAAPGLPPARTTLDTRIVLRGDAVLEWAPHHLVPYARADVHQRTAVDVAPGAGLLLWETLSAGRSGRGERFAWDLLDTRTRITREGLPLLHDGAVLGPGGEPFDGADLAATVVVVVPVGVALPVGVAASQGGVTAASASSAAGPSSANGAPPSPPPAAPRASAAPRDAVPAGRLADALHAALTAAPGVLASASAVDRSLVVARIVARDASALYRALDDVRVLARPAVGLPPPRRPVV